MFELNQLLLDTPRIGSYTLFSSILQKFPLVKKITLIQVLEEISWEVLPETFRQAFLKCLCLPTMKELSVEYIINFPLSAQDNKTIKILTLGGWKYGWKYDSKIKVLNPGDTSVDPFPQIESLSIFGCENQSVQKTLPLFQG